MLKDIKGNPAFNMEQIEISPAKSLGKKSLVFDKKSLTYWEDYFSRFDEIAEPTTGSASKAERLNELRTKN